jgi:hypothetical protein
VHSIGYNFHRFFLLAILLRNQQFLLKFILSVGRKQSATTMLDFEHVTRCWHFFVVPSRSFQPQHTLLFQVRGATLCTPRTQRKDSGLSPAEAVFSAQIVLPNEFVQNDALSVDTIVKNSKTLHVSPPSLPRHNSSTDLPSELPAKLLSASLLWVRWGGDVPPLQPLYDGPYVVLQCGPRSFTIRVGSRDEVVAISRLKACTAADAKPGSPRYRGRPPARAQVVLPQPSRSCFKTRWFLHLLLLRRCHETVPEPFFYPARRFLHARNWWHLRSLHRCGTRPVNEHCPRGLTSDLFSSQLRPELGGSPVESCLCPWRRSNQSGIL